MRDAATGEAAPRRPVEPSIKNVPTSSDRGRQATIIRRSTIPPTSITRSSTRRIRK